MSERICPACKGERGVHALVDGRTYSGPRWVPCFFCEGMGRVNGTQFDRWKIGRSHRDARVANGESMHECARRLGISVAELSAMENGRSDPTRLADQARPRVVEDRHE